MKTEARQHMFLTDSNLCYSAWGITEAEAAAAIRFYYPNIRRLIYLGAQ